MGNETSNWTKRPLWIVSGILLITVLSCGLAVHFKLSHQLREALVFQAAQSVAQQVSPLRRLAQARIALAEARLKQFAASRNASGPGQVRQFGEFALVATLEVTGAESNVVWIEKGPLFEQFKQTNESGQARLELDEELVLLKSIQPQSIPAQEWVWTRLADSRGQPVWALIVSLDSGADAQGSRLVGVGFMPRNPLAQLTEDYNSSGIEAMIVDAKGYLASHSKHELVGALYREDPVVREVFKSQESSGRLYFDGQKTSTLTAADQVGFFEKLDRSNLYIAVVSQPVLAAQIGWRETGLAIVFAFAVGVFLIFSWGTRILPAVQVGRSTGSGFTAPVATEVSSPIELKLKDFAFDEPTQSASSPLIIAAPHGPARDSQLHRPLDRDFIRRLQSSVLSVLKQPLLSAVAQLRLFKVKLQMQGDANSSLSESALEHLGSLERELDRMREALTEIDAFNSQLDAPASHSESGSSEQRPMRQVVTAWLETSSVLARARHEGVQVEAKSLLRLPDSLISEDVLCRALDAMAENALLAMHGREDKKLTLEFVPASLGLFSIRMTDTGFGMDREALQNATEPYYSRFTHPSAKGLGLTRARLAAESLGGRIELSSSLGEGTAVNFIVPGQLFPEPPAEARPPAVENKSLFDDADQEDDQDQWVVNPHQNLGPNP